MRDVTVAVAFYRETLDFTITYQQPEHEPFFEIVSRDRAMIMLKAAMHRHRPTGGAIRLFFGRPRTATA